VAFQFFFTKTHFTKFLVEDSRVSILAETDEYERIFSALKHPIRRQVLLFLERKGEASFADIQKDQGVDDTGLLSYHLRELTPLVIQSARGRYRLSETGRASLTLLRKVETEKQSLGMAVQREIGKLTSKIVFLFLIIGVALMVPLSTDIYFSIQYVYPAGLSTGQIAVIFLASLAGMILSLILFVIYDLHYFHGSRKNITHVLLFALGVSALSFLSTFTIFIFQMGTMRIGSTSSAPSTNTILIVDILRTASFIGITPAIAYLIIKKHQLHR
jgi:DNA-binding transcriptional ArsR family regulator